MGSVAGPALPGAGPNASSSAAARAASSRSHSNNQLNGRKGHSVKKSSQKAVNLSQVGGKQAHAKKVGQAAHEQNNINNNYDQAYQQ